MDESCRCSRCGCCLADHKAEGGPSGPALACPRLRGFGLPKPMKRLATTTMSEEKLDRSLARYWGSGRTFAAAEG